MNSSLRRYKDCKMLVCRHCLKSSSISDWNKATRKFYNTICTVETAISRGSTSCNFICPNCEKESTLVNIMPEGNINLSKNGIYYEKDKLYI